MKTKWMPTAMTAMAALVLGFAVFNLTGCKKSEPAGSGTHAQQYTCPMHSEVVKDAPGDCPKCGMKLVGKK